MSKTPQTAENPDAGRIEDPNLAWEVASAESKNREDAAMHRQIGRYILDARASSNPYGVLQENANYASHLLDAGDGNQWELRRNAIAAARAVLSVDSRFAIQRAVRANAIHRSDKEVPYYGTFSAYDAAFDDNVHHMRRHEDSARFDGQEIIDRQAEAAVMAEQLKPKS